MDETMKNTEMDVVTEETGVDESTYNYEVETTSKPSKGFVALVVGGVLAVAAGIAVAVKKHNDKKNRACIQLGEENFEEFEDEDFFAPEDSETDLESGKIDEVSKKK